MWDWMTENVTSLQVLVSLLSTVVWIVYLNIFLASFRRQTRSSLLINRAGAHDMQGRCLVSNMGSEPAFLLDVLAEVASDESVRTVSVVDRLELWDTETDPRGGVSAEGPIASGDYVDIGSFDDILKRAAKAFGEARGVPQELRIELVAIAATNQARQLVAAHRGFELCIDEEAMTIRPLQIQARQIRSRRQRHRIGKLLEELQVSKVIDRSVTGDLRPKET